MKSILIIYEGDATLAPRIHQQLYALNKNYKIILACFKFNLKVENVEFLDINEFYQESKSNLNFHNNYPLLFRKLISFIIKYFVLLEFSEKLSYLKKYWTQQKKNFLAALSDLEFDLIICHHLAPLPLVVKLASNENVPFIVNAHEYYPREFEDNMDWVRTTQKYYNFLCTEYLTKSKKVFAVCNSIANEYRKNYFIEPVEIPNDKKYYELEPQITCLENVIHIVHHGASIRSRELERMADLMSILGYKYVLHFLLLPTDKIYHEELILKYNNVKNIVFEELVEVDKIPIEINKYDIGLFILPPVNFNWENALPNKFFEFLQARLCIAVSPNTEMKKYVEDYDLGVVADDYTAEAMAKKILSLSVEQIKYHKEQCNKNAKILSSENTQLKILHAVKELIG